MPEGKTRLNSRIHTAAQKPLPAWTKPAALSALTLAAAAFLAAIWPQNINPSAFYASTGEVFLQNLPASFRPLETHMPVKSVFEALLRYHMTPEGKALLVFLCDTATGLALFCGGLLLGGWPAGALAVILQRQIVSTEPIFSLAVLLAAILFAARAKTYSRTVNIALGLAIGFGLLYRRVLFLLPFAIAMIDLLEAERARRGRAFLQRSLPLICATGIVLVPWIAYNRQIYGDFVAFERNGTALNIVAAALGSTYTLEGGALDLAGIQSGQSAILWAAQHILAHPLAYVTALFLRIAALFKMHPFLFMAAALGFLFRRKQRDYIAVFMTAVCFGGTYLLMSIEERYFEPLWPLLAILAAAAFANFLPKSMKTECNRTATIGALLLFAPLFSFGIWISAKLLAARPPAQSNREELIRERLKWTPQSEWLREQLAQAEFSPDKYKAGMAHSRQHTSPRIGAGKTSQGLETNSIPELIYHAAQSDTVNTARSLLFSYSGKVQSTNYVRYAATDREMLMNASLMLLAQSSYKDSLEDGMSKLPENVRNRIGHTIHNSCSIYGIYAPGVCPETGTKPSTRAELDRFAKDLLGTGNDKTALTRACEVLDRNNAAYRKVLGDLLPQGADFSKTFADIKVGCELVPAVSFHTKGLLAQANGNYREAVRYLDRAIAAYPNNSSFYVDRGVALALAGDNHSARSDFEQAIRMSPTNMAAYMSLGSLYELEHNPHEAMTAYRTALEQHCLGDWHCSSELRENMESALRRLR